METSAHVFLVRLFGSIVIILTTTPIINILTETNETPIKAYLLVLLFFIFIALIVFNFLIKTIDRLIKEKSLIFLWLEETTCLLKRSNGLLQETIDLLRQSRAMEEKK